MTLVLDSTQECHMTNFLINWRLAVCLAGLFGVCADAGFSQELDAHKKPRILRPLQGGVSDVIIRTGAGVDSPIKTPSDFSLGASRNDVQQQQAAAAPSLSLGTSDASRTHPTVPRAEAKAEAGRALVGASTSMTERKGDTSGSNGAVPPKCNESDDAEQEPVQKTIIVRMTGYKEDTEIIPKINADAISMANNLLETKKRKCVILLERTSVKLATGGCGDMAVSGKLVDFRKLLKEFMAAGGTVVLNKRWAEEFGVQPRDCIAGVTIVSPADIAELVVDADKIMDYATPNYPANLKFYMNKTTAIDQP
jgi:hypothetical protein